MTNKIETIIVGDKQLKKNYQRMFSLLFLFIASYLSLLEYTKEDVFLWFDGSFSITPGFLSTIIALVLVSPLYIRRILKWNKSFYSILSFVLIMMLFSSFLQLAMGGKDSMIIKSLVLVGAALSWLGMRSIAGLSWILAFSAAIYSIIINGITMGFYGFIYISAGALGLILHSGFSPGELVAELKTEFSKPIDKRIEGVKVDVNDLIAQRSIRKIKKLKKVESK